MIVKLLQAAAFAVGFRAGFRWRRRRQAAQLHKQTHPRTLIRKEHSPRV